MLTEKHVERFIAVQKDMSAVVEGVYSDRAKYKAALRSVIKKHGYKNMAEYEAVAASISIVIAAIDPQTKIFTDPQTVITKQLEEIGADKTIATKEKEELLRQLNVALKSAQLIQFPTNVELVQKYYDKIDVTMIATYEGERSSNSGVVRTISE
jgi:hypothetical protein